VHRWHAFRQAGRTDIPVVHFQDAVLDYEAAKTDLLLESARNNTTHGDRLTIADKKRIARDIAAADPDHTYTETALAGKLGVSRQAVNTWITDIRARQTAGREAVIIRLSRPGDRVLDPMAGGGVVPDVCLLFERKCRAFDQNPHPDRPEIEPHHWDPDTGEWPLTEKPDLIFFDPPYYTKLDTAYKAAAAPQAPSVSSLPREDYIRFFARFFTLAHDHTRPGTTLAFLNADWRNFESTPAAKETPDQA
jgi:hypothetical protein